MALIALMMVMMMMMMMMMVIVMWYRDKRTMSHHSVMAQMRQQWQLVL